jgi:hypothetical protein
VHSDKKKTLQELTRDIHQSPNKENVVSELAQCIASGNGTSLRLGRELLAFPAHTHTLACQQNQHASFVSVTYFIFNLNNFDNILLTTP